MALKIALFFIVFCFYIFVNGADSRKVCLGAVPESYDHLRQLYQNCTIIDGDLKINGFTVANTPDDADFEFLSTIEEITGCLEIIDTHIDRLPLTSLRVIHGLTLPSEGSEVESDLKDATMVIMRNSDDSSSHGGSIRGLRQVYMPNFKELVRGRVVIMDNAVLCYLNTVNWTDVIDEENSRVLMKRNGDKTICSPCHAGCSDSAGCWGPLLDDCVRTNKITCAPQCADRCFNPHPTQCCHGECAGGCTGVTASQCLVILQTMIMSAMMVLTQACKNYVEEGKCVSHCTKRETTAGGMSKHNPNGKYVHANHFCVSTCSEEMVSQGDHCVASCLRGYKEVNKTCIYCENGVCPKNCEFHSNVDLVALQGCTRLEGSLVINKAFFHGDVFERTSPLADQSLLQNLADIREITGYLSIEYTFDISIFPYLRNLAMIEGRQLKNGYAPYKGHYLVARQILLNPATSFHVVPVQLVPVQEVHIESRSTH